MKTILSLLIISPLMAVIVYNGFYAPNVTTPLFFLALVITIVSVIALYRYLASAKERAMLMEKMSILKAHPLSIGLACWLVAQLLSLFSAYHTSFAWWGHPARWGGVISSIIFFTLFAELVLFMKERQWQKLFIAASISTVILFIGEIVDLFTISDRPMSFAGNPLFLCQLFLFGFLAMYFAVKHTKTITKRTTLWITGLILFIGILFTQSRAVVLALGIAGVLTGGLWFVQMIKTKEAVVRKKIVKRTAIVFASILLVFGTLHFATGGKVWSHIPGVNRIVATTSTDNSLRARLGVYKTSFAMMNPKEIPASRFLFGWGNDNYEFAWFEHYDPSFYSNDRAYFDRSHNILLDALVMNGVVGLLVFLGVLVLLYRTIFKLKKETPVDFLFTFFIFTTYFLQAMTAPDAIGTPYYIYLFAAYLIYRTTHLYEKK